MITISIILRNNGVYFAVRLTGANPEKLLDPTYFNFMITQSSYIRQSSGVSIKSTPIEFEYWGNKFPYVEKKVYDRVGLVTYICPKNTDFFCKSKPKLW